MAILLDRRQSRLFAQESTSSLTQSQLHLDSALHTFSEHAADPIALASMTLGSFAFKAARFSFLSGANALGVTRYVPQFLMNPTVNLAALGVEVTAFRSSNNFLGSLAGHAPEQDVFDPRGFAGTLTDFLALKTIGHLGAGHNVALTHFAQANAMTLGHAASAELGFTTHEGGTYIERLVKAEITNMSLGAGTAIMGRLTGGRIQQAESRLEANIAALTHVTGLRTLSPSVPPLLPSMHRNLGALEGKVVLIANRGEAATRAARTAQGLGLRTVVLTSDADLNSLHTNLPGTLRLPIGGTKIMESYGDIAKLQKAIRETARRFRVPTSEIIVWPGWGGSAENPALPRMVRETGALFAGPSDFAMDLLGPKTSSNEVARASGLQPVPASERIVYKVEKDILDAMKQRELEIKLNHESDLLAGRTQNPEVDPTELQSQLLQVRTEIEESNRRSFEQARSEYERIYNEYGKRPVMIKGAETGGGKGIRVIETPADFEKMFLEAVGESRATSPSADVFIAKYLTQAHHLEAQVIADAEGNIRVMGIRQCSLQRSQQKVQELDITALLPRRLRDHIIQQATSMMTEVRRRDVASGVGYTNAVTIEFLWDLAGLPANQPFSGDPAERLFILEANTRLQVEHCVTEEAVRLRRNGHLEKLDFVEWQLRIAAGERIDFAQEDLTWPFATHQARICAEDPYNNFLPSPGRISLLEVPDEEGIRVDCGVETQREVTEHYDSLLAKVMHAEAIPENAPRDEHGDLTPEAVEAIHGNNANALIRYLKRWEMAGIRHNVPFHLALLGSPQVKSGFGIYTKFIEREFLNSEAGQRNYQHWDVALITSAIATYVGRRQRAIAEMTAGRSLDDLSSIEMEIGGNEMVMEVRESGPNDFHVSPRSQNIEFKPDEGQSEVRVLGKNYQVQRDAGSQHYYVDFEGQRLPLNSLGRNRYQVVLSGIAYPVSVDISGPIYTVTIGGISHRTLVDSRQGKRFVQIVGGGTEYDVNISGEGILSRDHVTAPLAGKIITPPNLMPKVGDMVEEGQVVLMEEAMKMQTPIRARQSGRVAEVNARSGDMVQPNTSLVRIEAIESGAETSRAVNLPEPGELISDVLTDALVRADSSSKTSARAELDSIAAESVQGLLNLYRRASLGFDVSPEVLSEGIAYLQDRAHTNPAERTQIIEGLRIVLEQFAHVQGLYHPRHGEEMNLYLLRRNGGGEPSNAIFADALRSALAAYEVTNTNPGATLNETLYRISRARQNLPRNHVVMGKLLALIHTLDARELATPLKNVLRNLHEEVVPKKLTPLTTQIQDVIHLLENASQRNQDWQERLEEAFTEAIHHTTRWVEFIRATHLPAQRFLISKMGSASPHEVQRASDLYFGRLYDGPNTWGGRHVAGSSLAHTNDPQVSYGIFHSVGSENQKIHREFFLGRAETIENIEAALSAVLAERRVMNDLPQTQRYTDGVIEIVVTQAPEEGINFEAINAQVTRLMQGQSGIKRVTLSIAQQGLQGLEAPRMRTYRPNGPNGEFIVHEMFNDIHPMAAWRLELNRWGENFYSQRLADAEIHPEVHAFRMQDKASKDAGRDPRKGGDLRNVVVAQVSEVLSLRRFDANIERDALQALDALTNSDFYRRAGGLALEAYNALRESAEATLSADQERALRVIPLGLKLAESLPAELESFCDASTSGSLPQLIADLKLNPQSIGAAGKALARGALTAEQETALRAIPWGLQLAGKLGANKNPFDIETMQGSLADLVGDYELTPDLIREASRTLEGRVYSIPEAEKQALNALSTLSRAQASTPDGPTTARIDLFVRPPMEVRDDEIAFVVGRKINAFTDQRLEKTVIHFQRQNGRVHGEEIAIVRAPAMARIDLKIETVTDHSPHRVIDDPVKVKRLSAQARGGLWVFDRVALLREVATSIYPKGTSVPEDAIQMRELILSGGKLIPTDRPRGQNDASMVVFEVTAKFPKNLEGSEHYERRMLWVGNDYTTRAGALGPHEANIYSAAFEKAMSEGLPIHYASESSGAMIGFAEEVFKNINRTYDAENNRWTLWATPEQLAKTLEAKRGKGGKPLSELVTLGNPVTFEGQNGFEIRSVISDAFLNTESLKGSAKTARPSALAGRYVPVFGSAHGVTIGIGTYDWVLTQMNMIPVSADGVDEAAAALTGPRPVNATLGTAYRAAKEYAGARRLADAGIAAWAPTGERGVAENLLRLVGMLPQNRRQEAEVINTGDPIDRDISPALNTLIPGKGKPFNMRLVIDEIFDRGALGGTVEMWRHWGPSIIVGFARLNGRTVGYLFPQPQPDKVDAESGRGPFYGSTLDMESAEKGAAFIQLANNLGLDLVMDPAFAGFMPDGKNVSGRVYDGGAKIVRALADFENAVVQWLHPYAEWWGGCVAVMEKAINPEHIITTSDATAAIGILGAQGALEVPMVTRALDNAVNTDSRVIDLRRRIEGAPSANKAGLTRELTSLIETLRREEYALLLQTFYNLGNTAERAAVKNTVDRVIEVDDRSQTRRILSDTLEAKRSEIRQRRATALSQDAALRILEGVVAFANAIPNTGVEVSLKMLPDGKVAFCVGSACLTQRPARVVADFQDMLSRGIDGAALARLIPNAFKRGEED